SLCARGSKTHAIGSLEAERSAGFVPRRNLVAKLLEDAADLRHLLGIALGELARADIERILEADAHVAAHHRGVGTEIHLVTAAGKHRPIILIAEQTIGGAFHEQEIVELGADAAEDSEDQLQEHRRLEQATVDAMREVVQVPSVVAFVLELDAVAFAKKLG